ncbi:MAG TPA: CAP family protein [Ktedonosporobacter sp.]|nr:CAP family protein [Ktedonosporobacter sp.]
MALTVQDQQAIVAAHNAYRSDPAINTPALQWDSTLATGAQSWADNLATTVHDLKHSDPSTRQGLGENIAMGSKGNYTPAQMVDFWGKTVISGSSEQGNFKPGTFSTASPSPVSKTGDWSDVGHYTQVIWRTTTSVGCGVASDGTNDYMVCRYSPAGNMEGVQVP